MSRDRQQRIYEFVKARGYLSSNSSEVLAALQICKMAEELGELALAVEMPADGWVKAVIAAGRLAKEHFDNIAIWSDAVVYFSVVRTELRDTVPLFVLAEIAGIDLVEECFNKALADVARGIR